MVREGREREEPATISTLTSVEIRRDYAHYVIDSQIE
jgi:hypothetical protein